MSVGMSVGTVGSVGKYHHPIENALVYVLSTLYF